MTAPTGASASTGRFAAYKLALAIFSPGDRPWRVC